MKHISLIVFIALIASLALLASCGKDPGTTNKSADEYDGGEEFNALRESSYRRGKRK